MAGGREVYRGRGWGGRSKDVEVVVGFYYKKTRNKDKNAYHSVGRMGRGGGHLDPLHDFPNGYK